MRKITLCAENSEGHVNACKHYASRWVRLVFDATSFMVQNDFVPVLTLERALASAAR